MIVKKLDVSFSDCRFMFERGLDVPVIIHGRLHVMKEGEKGTLSSVCLSEAEAWQLYYFLGDYLKPAGGSDGA